MDAQEVLLRQLPLQLPHGFHKGLAFHIAHRAAHFGDNDVIVPSLPQQEHPALDFVRNVRNNLDGLSQVSPLPFLGDDGVVDSARGDIIGLRGVNAQKTFIVAQVQVRLGAVLRHVAFPVLVRIQRSGVYIQIGVEFLDGDAKASCLQQFGQRGRNNSFTQGGSNASRNENILCIHSPIFIYRDSKLQNFRRKTRKPVNT